MIYLNNFGPMEGVQDYTIYVCTRVYSCIYISIYIYTHTHTHIHTHIHVCLCVSVCVRVYVNVCKFVELFSVATPLVRSVCAFRTGD